MSNVFAHQQPDGSVFIGVKEPAPVAKRIQPGRMYALLYGPDAKLKAAVAAYRAIHPDHDVHLRTTDQSVANADDTPCDVRIIVVSERMQAWTELWDAHKMPYVRATFNDSQGLRFIEGGTAEPSSIKPLSQEKAEPQAFEGSEFQPPTGVLTLQNGVEVDMTVAFLKGAANLGIAPEAMSAMDGATQLEIIHAAYDLAYVAPVQVSDALRAGVRALTTPKPSPPPDAAPPPSPVPDAKPPTRKPPPRTTKKPRRK